jgi:hypothetical protein
MGKLDRKKTKLQNRINELQEELRLSLTKKSSNSVEIDVASHQRKITDLRVKLSQL